METAIVKYEGNYAGCAAGINFEPGQTREVPLEKAELLVLSGQFTVVEVKKQ